MIRIIDGTLTKVDDCLPSKEQILLFCQLMKEIGIVDLALSKEVNRQVGSLPEGYRFYVHEEYAQTKKMENNIYKYIVYHSQNEPNVISEYQINDVRELIQLKAMMDKKQLFLVGFDDVICHNYEQIMKEMKQTLKNSNIILCPENTYGVATATAVQWLLLGGETVSTSFAGYGNRAPTEEVLVAMRVIKRYKPNQTITALLELKELFQDMTKTKIIGSKPVLGSEIFAVESGIHVDGIIKNPSNYEAFDPKIIGQSTTITLGKHSGSNSIKIKLKQLGIQVESTETIQAILYKVKYRSMELRNSISDEDFVQIIKEVIAK